MNTHAIRQCRSGLAITHNVHATACLALQKTPRLIVMWRPDMGKYTAHMQEPAPPNAPNVVEDASCNVIPQQIDAQAGVTGPLLRAWQADPFNRNSLYFAGYDNQACTVALALGLAAPWVTKPGPLSSKGLPTPVYEGVAPTNHVTSTECGDRCAFTSQKLMATALVSNRLLPLIPGVSLVPLFQVGINGLLQ